MTEHERLKMICDEIGFENNNYDDKRKIFKKLSCNNEYRKMDVREIIFTSKFMEKLINKRKDWNIEIIPCKSLTDIFYSELMNNLHDPVTYLYDLIFNK